MPNANATLAYPTRTILHWVVLGLASGITGSHWVHQAWLWVRQAFWILTCRYWQHEPLAFWAVPNPKTQREWFHVTVEYKLKAHIPLKTGFALANSRVANVEMMHKQHEIYMKYT